MKEPQVHVGILLEPQIEFLLPTPYCIGGRQVSGRQLATYHQGRIQWNGSLHHELVFEPLHPTDSFELLDVTIGINFHWERKENQRFLGALKIITEDGKLTAINMVQVEDYLTSVISSEMSANASLELLKAHAVISRSWLLANLGGATRDEEQGTRDDVQCTIESNAPSTPGAAHSQFSILNSQLKWYERDAHTRFDVCADDHCQRYQGITRASTELVEQAIAATRGQVLTSGGKICDARFSKCCGGAFEEFRYCWEDVQHPYLARQRDWKGEAKDAGQHPAKMQKDARAYEALIAGTAGAPTAADGWIRTAPAAFCNTTDKRILAQVLNNYDQETTDFYRWRVEYSQKELSTLIRKRSGIDFGAIIDLIPVARGTSGRLWKLTIAGTKQTLTIGKELEIRRTLSPTHLYSSAFVVDKEGTTPEGLPARFILTGAGWGHGVGLCQIGAAVMGEQGYPYTDILLHYYIGAAIEKQY